MLVKFRYVTLYSPLLVSVLDTALLAGGGRGKRVRVRAYATPDSAVSYSNHA